MKRTFNWKLFAAFFSFFISVACLIASTIAWYEQGRLGRIDLIEVTMRGETDILIGLKAPEEKKEALMNTYGPNTRWKDGIFYVNEVTMPLLIAFDYIANNHRLFPITASNERSWLAVTGDENRPFDYTDSKDYPQFYAIPDRVNIHGLPLAQKEVRQFAYQFDFYMMTTQNLYLFLDQQSYITADYKKNEETAKKLGEDVARLNQVEKFLRLSTYARSERFTNYQLYDFDPNKSTKDNIEVIPYYGRLDISPQDMFYDSFYDTDTNAFYETLYGDYENKSALVYSEDARETGNEVVFKNSGGFIANSADGVNPVSINASLEKGLIGYQERQSILKQDLVDKKNYESKLWNSFAYCEANVPTKVIFSVWAEGWDRDCNDASQSASFLSQWVVSGQEPIHFRP